MWDAQKKRGPTRPGLPYYERSFRDVRMYNLSRTHDLFISYVRLIYLERTTYLSRTYDLLIISYVRLIYLVRHDLFVGYDLMRKP